MKNKDKILVAVAWVGLLLLIVQIWSLNKNDPDEYQPSDQVVPDPIASAKQIKSKKTLVLSEKEKHCLVRNIYYEAGVEDMMGKIAVAQVTVNRLKSGRWGNDLCAVVYARKQFSWTLEKAKLQGSPKGQLWEISMKAKEMFLEGHRVPELKDSMFYHADYIKHPKWSKKMKQVKKIGQHIFYKEVR